MYFYLCRPITIVVVVLVLLLALRPAVRCTTSSARALQQFAARLAAAVQQIGVHNVIVVGLQGRPKVVLAMAGQYTGHCGRTVDAARTVRTVRAAPRVAPQVPIGVALFLQQEIFRIKQKMFYYSC